ncbi:MAG: tRNA (N(6)-L-threonylcarbamoyladenosine(37)-C(2))-methylthiotransferase MtaB [Lactobacillales bacterium]|nr:tRNA (N(6)-L-threonylcarbamoyladenosine(37)-C(2))-methylthiotransferase MtaB [Lactobacillales bacterium]
MKFNIYTLGCKVNTYESNVMSDLLKNKGYIEVSVDEKADISIINTCTVTNTADNKSLKTVRHAIKENKDAIIVVVGCMSQNKKEEVLKIDGVDIVLGNIGKSKIVEYIDEYIKTKNQKLDIYDMMDTTFEPMILNNFNKTRAFVKIQDGCNNYCSYCIIPYVRGNVRSKDSLSVIKEVKELVSNGHKEIVLTGIHTGHYGSDLDNYNFSNLLTDLCKIEKLERLRISSIEITELTDEFLSVLENNKILVDHMHIPLQSGSDTVLKRMNRKYDKKYFIEKIEKIRKIRPDMSVTTDVITGFPGETEEEFKETIETIKKVEFTKLHVFPYSRRKGTVADEMENQIDEKIKKERVKILMTLSKELEIKYMEKFIDKEVVFIPEIIKDEYLIGHTGNYLNVKIKGEENLIGENVKIKLKYVEYPYIIGCKEK